MQGSAVIAKAQIRSSTCGDDTVSGQSALKHGRTGRGAREPARTATTREPEINPGSTVIPSRSRRTRSRHHGDSHIPSRRDVGRGNGRGRPSRRPAATTVAAVSRRRPLNNSTRRSRRCCATASSPCACSDTDLYGRSEGGGVTAQERVERTQDTCTLPTHGHRRGQLQDVEH